MVHVQTTNCHARLSERILILFACYTALPWLHVQVTKQWRRYSTLTPLTGRSEPRDGDVQWCFYSAPKNKWADLSVSASNMTSLRKWTTCIYMYIYVCMCIYMCVYVCVCIYVYIQYVYICVYIYIHMYVCVYIYIYIKVPKYIDKGFDF